MPPRFSAILCLSLLSGLTSTAVAQTQARQPVISKVEILFSMVSHYNYIPSEAGFYNVNGIPPGNTNYGVPLLVYEPSVTLYNPYNEPLTMTRFRVKIWDPPVGFKFKKNDVYLRSDFASGNFHSLGRFQVTEELNTNVRKSFTLSLSSPTTSGTPGSPIVLQPGESKAFFTWVENNWTWGLETTSGYTSLSFYDWNPGAQSTNRDNRTSNNFGVEAIHTTSPFIFGDPRAGFQADCLSYYSGQRPRASLYSFESSYADRTGRVVINLNDTVSVEAKSMRTTPPGFPSDFTVEQLKGENQDASSDIARQYRIYLAGIVQNNEQPIISRTYRVGDILQTPTDKTPGGKSPFAKFTMIAKSSALRTNRFYASPAPLGNDLYELQFGEATDFGQIPSKPSDASPDAPPVVHGVSRSGNTLFIDFSGSSNNFGANPWKVRGTSSLAGGFNDNLDSATTVITSMSGSGIYKAIVDITGRGESYFVRIEE